MNVHAEMSNVQFCKSVAEMEIAPPLPEALFEVKLLAWARNCRLDAVSESDDDDEDDDDDDDDDDDALPFSDCSVTTKSATAPPATVAEFAKNVLLEMFSVHDVMGLQVTFKMPCGACFVVKQPDWMQNAPPKGALLLTNTEFVTEITEPC